MRTFKGGIHPYEGKDLSKDSPVRKMPVEGEMIFPLSQHIGAPAKPIVKVGDRVLMGQKIAEAGGFISAVVVSSVSGKVKRIEPRMTVSGAKVESIIIENDGKDEKVPGYGEKRDLNALSKEEIRSIIKEAGIVGMGGAGFPTHVKLTPKNEDEIDYVIVNGAECEPYLTSDYRMMLEESEQLVMGLKVIMKLFPKAQGVIAIEDNKPEAIEKIRAIVANESNISVKVLMTKYPQGAERQIISMVTGRKIGAAKLPADVGCIVDNVDTVLSIYYAVCESTPLVRRIITITGDAVREPKNVEVRIGMHYAQFIDEAGGFKETPVKLVSGGPMMGKAVANLNFPVTKTSSTLLAMTTDGAAEEETACIRCGRCVSACPMGLVPEIMASYAARGDVEGFISVYGLECYACGCCTYVCPAKRPLTQMFAQMRGAGLAFKRAQAAKEAAAAAEKK